MKVTTVTWRFPEPTEPQVNDQLTHMLDRGIDCEVIADEVRSSIPVSEDLRQRVAVRRSGSSGGLARPRTPALLTADADVVYFQHVGVALKYRRLLPKLDAALVVGCRGSDVRVDSIDRSWVGEQLRYVFPLVDRIHCVSNELAQHCRSFGARPDQLFVVPTGVSLDIFRRRPVPERSPALPLRIVSVGRLNWVKGFEYAVQAVALLRERGHRITYTIAGPDQGAAESVRLVIRDLGLQDVIRLVDQLPREGVRDLLAAADVFLLASLSEGAPVAAMEAMAVGLPVVVTDVGGTSEIVADGVHGYVVPPRDPAAIAAAVERLLPVTERRRLGEAAAEHARRDLDRSVQIGRLIDVFEQLGPSSAACTPPVLSTELTSVVIPARNAADTIDDQLRALALQRFAEPWEVLIVDHGSTDGTRRRVLAWRDRLPGLRVIDAAEARTLGEVRNIGVRAASGTRILMCDADDIVAPGWLEALAGALREHPLVCGSLERSLLAKPGTGHDHPPGAGADALGRIRLLTGNCGVRRELFDQLGGFDAELNRGEDLDFGWRARRAGCEICHVAGALVHYRPQARLADVARQGLADGRCWPALVVRHRDLPLRPTQREVLDRYRDLARGRASRTWADSGPGGWTYGMAWSAGRAIGSLRHRVIVL